MPRKIRIISVGKVKEPYIMEGIAEYEKRLRPFAKIEFVRIKDSDLEKESEEIGRHLHGSAYILDVLGKETGSQEFAALLKPADMLTFIVGGPFGISDSAKKKAKLLSLSKMTFTHEMCQLFLLEQIYRGFQINTGRPYHK